MSNPEPKNIFIVEDYPILAEALSSVISREEDLRICRTATSEDEAIESILYLEPDVVLMDLSLKREHGPAFIRRIREQMPKLPIVVLSMHNDLFFAEICEKAGANAFTTKADEPSVLIEAIRIVLAGRFYMSPTVKRRDSVSYQADGKPVFQQPEELLTRREYDILQRIGEGFSNRQIADKLNVSRKTVQIQQVRIKKKLRLTNTFELTQLAVRMFDKTLNYESNRRNR